MKKQKTSDQLLRNTVKVGAFSPYVNVGNPTKNVKNILDVIKGDERLKNCDIVVTPELSITGYSCQDMFMNTKLLGEASKALETLVEYMPNNMILSVGAPLVIGTSLYNCSFLLTHEHGIIGVTPKTYIANYGEFYEARWFTGYNGDEPNTISDNKGSNTPFGRFVIHTDSAVVIGCELCEDLWAVETPSNKLALAGANIIINNSASDETVGKAEFRRDLVRMQSAKTLSAYIYCSAGMTESVSDVIYGGHNIIAENGKILAESDLYDITGRGIVVADIDMDILIHERIKNKTFSTLSKKYTNIDRTVVKGIFKDPFLKPTYVLDRTVDIQPFVPKDMHELKRKCDEIFNIQSNALACRWMSTGSKHLIIGVSGGLDSTLALLVACRAADIIGKSREMVVGITMPCFGTTSRTKSNAVKLMEELGCTVKEIDISKAVEQHLADLDISMEDRSVAFENAQARERTQVLMDYGNKVGGFVVGTGDLSEAALGWCTYNGDHSSMYNVNASVPKTLVRSMVDNVFWRLVVNGKSNRLEETIKDILDTPVSPELLPPNTDGTIQQLTESSVGPYVLNDLFIYYHVRYGMSKEKIFQLAVIASGQDDEYNYSEYEIKKWLDKFYERFYRAQFKRNFCPDGIKVGSVALSPRGDWRCPSEFDSSLFE